MVFDDESMEWNKQQRIIELKFQFKIFSYRCSNPNLSCNSSNKRWWCHFHDFNYRTGTFANKLRPAKKYLQCIIETFQKFNYKIPWLSGQSSRYILSNTHLCLTYISCYQYIHFPTGLSSWFTLIWSSSFSKYIEIFELVERYLSFNKPSMCT